MTEKCDNKIYSDFTYEKAREENLRRVSEYYNKILSDYTKTYSKYLSSTSGTQITPVPTNEKWEDIPANTNPPLDVDPSMKADQTDMAGTVLRPKLVDLNKQLILVQKHLLENNLKMKNTIIEQRKIITSNETEIRRKEKLVKELDASINRAKDQTKLGETRMEDEKHKIHSYSFRYWIWAITLIILVGANITFYMMSPSDDYQTVIQQINSINKSNNNNYKINNNNKKNNK